MKILTLRQTTPAKRRTAVVLVLRFVGLTGLFAQTWLLTHLLSSKEFGDYAWALAWVTIARLLVTLGLDKLLVREAAVATNTGDWGRIRGLIRAGDQAVRRTFLIVAPVILAVAWIIAANGTAQWAALAAGISWLLLIAVLTVRQSTLQGLGRVIQSRLPEDVVFPGAFIVLLGTAWLFFGHALTAPAAMVLRVGSLLAALGVGILLLRRELPTASSHEHSERVSIPWTQSVVPLVLIGSSGVLISELGTVVVGAVSGSSAAGAYALALRVAFVLTLGEFAVQTVLGPLAARLYANGEHARLQTTVTRSARATFALALLPGVVFLVEPGMVLRIFGGSYDSAAAPLQALTVGWFLNFAAGPCGLLLVMTGFEQQAARILVIGAAVNLPLCVVLTYVWGPVGAGVATAFSMVLWNAAMVWQVRRGHRLDTTVLGSVGLMGRG